MRVSTPDRSPGGINVNPELVVRDRDGEIYRPSLRLLQSSQIAAFLCCRSCTWKLTGLRARIASLVLSIGLIAFLNRWDEVAVPS